MFILGAPRSGTSLLYRALALHPQACWINNYQRRMPALPELAALNRVANLASKPRLKVWFGAGGDNAYRYNNERSVLDRWFPQPVEGEPLFRHRGIPEQSDAHTATAAQLKLRGDFARMMRSSGGDVVISKRIGHNLRIPLLHAIFPSARFIDLTRDGRAVAASLLEVDWWPSNHLWWRGGTPSDAERAGIDPAVTAATHWNREVEAISSGLQGVAASQVLHLRYEDLIADPHSVLQTTATFAGLPRDPGWLGSLSHLRFPDKNTNWKERLGDRALAVTAVEQALLSALGYLD